MVNRFRIVALAAVLSFGSIAVLSGCDWLKSSGSTERVSPFLSGLSIAPSSVLCSAEFTVSFSYDDPQGDISGAQIFLQREGDAAVRQEAPLWPANQSRNAGTVSFPLSFSCDSRGGRYTVTVDVVDDRGHLSNQLTGTINLNAAG